MAASPTTSPASGPPLVLVHAGITDRGMWDDVWEDLARSHTVIRYDTRGFGETRITDPTVAYSNRADLIAVLDHLGIQRAALCGVSRAGSIVVDTTLEFPDRVSALIPVAAGLGGFEVEPTPQEEVAFTELERLEEAKDWPAVVERELRVWVDGLGRAPDRVPQVRSASARCSSRSTATTRPTARSTSSRSSRARWAGSPTCASRPS